MRIAVTPNQTFNADSLQRGICFANFTPRRKPLRRQAGSVLPVNLALGDSVGFLKTIQWLLGLLLAFYFYKALLGKLRDGDGLKASIAAAVWFSAALITSGFVKTG